MSELSLKMKKAMADTALFCKLTPAEMLENMILDISANGSIKTGNYQHWTCVKDQLEMDQADRFDFLLQILDQENPSRTLKVMLTTDLLAVCLPLCFPLRNKSARHDLISIIDNYDRSIDDTVLRAALFFFPFDRPAVKQTLTSAECDAEATDVILFSLEYVEDFLLVKDKAGLKRFIYRHGQSYYEFIDHFARQLCLMLEFPEYKQRSKEYLLAEVNRLKEPIFPSDLCIKEEALLEIGITEKSELTAMMKILAEHCHSKPLDNKEETLLKKAKGYKKSRLKRVSRNINWLK